MYLLQSCTIYKCTYFLSPLTSECQDIYSTEWFEHQPNVLLVPEEFGIINLDPLYSFRLWTHTYIIA